MLLERARRVFKEPIDLLVGFRRAPVGSELAKNDFKGLLCKAEYLVRYAAERIQEEEFDLLVDLVKRGVRLELIVGKSQDLMVLARLQSKGVEDVWRSEQKIPSPFVIVDGAHTVIHDREDEMIPIKAKPIMQIIAFKDFFLANIDNNRFEKLLSSSKK